MARISEEDIEKEVESLLGGTVILSPRAADIDRTLRGRRMTSDRTPPCTETPV